MKYLALLSGGKDSCYNLVHCAKNGHELVAAASLGPEVGKEELDSYLYQTVGQDAIELVAQALDVPLFRKVISGNAVNQGSEYGERHATAPEGVKGDETEDLYDLLVTVKKHHPDVKGVSVGAILSNYQRVRVEHVCQRLDLTPLCFLWQRNQADLLSEMIESGMEAILIKVAGIGLTTSHLGKNLSEMKITLHKLNTLYGSHICGEGGEYETLTLDCPLFKRRIRLIETETVIHSDSDFATVAFLRIKAANLEDKQATFVSVVAPPLLDEDHQDIELVVAASENSSGIQSSPVGTTNIGVEQPSLSLSTSRQKGKWVAVSNVQIKPSENDITLEEEVSQCFRILSDCLALYNLQLPHISSINIYISHMDLFARVNGVYATYFGVSPPARACVGVDLPQGIRIRLECIAFSEETPRDRQSLHVQGLSYWAPANIGPYSQAITVSERVFVSGQIGLIPSQLALPSPRLLSLEMALASQHASRIVSALKENSGGGWVGFIQLAIYWLTEVNNLAHVKAGHLVLPVIQQFPTLFLVVKELPKNAAVEKQILVHTGRCEVVDDFDGETTIENKRPAYQHGSQNLGGDCVVHWEVSHFEDGAACGIIFIVGDFGSRVAELKKAVANLLPILKETLSVRLLHRVTLSLGSLCGSIFGDECFPPITPIPCRRISSTGRDDWDFAICFVTGAYTSSL